ncbi:MAG: hypothetical protein OEZ13_10685 [Spirochaetia bacterium]|nr:hypothetical protein [Spirochaetia bacterium]
MKCNKQPHWAKEEIKNIWNVHLDVYLWENVKLAAQMHSKSFSWIVRYCVFQVTLKKNIRWTNKMNILHKSIKKNASKITHRHQLCLYGCDEILLRNAAIQLKISVSQLIRISLCMFLDRLLKKKVSKENLFWYGIKIIYEIKDFRSVKNKILAMHFRSFKAYSDYQYWGFL